MLNSNELGNLSDRELLAEARAYHNFLANNPAGLNFTSADATKLDGLNDDFETALDEWDGLQMQEHAAQLTKEDKRALLLEEVRRQRNMAYADSAIKNETLASYGLPPRDKVATASPQPTTAPIGRVEYGKLRHTIHFRDSATPDKKAKPKGMLGCEIWRFAGDAPPAGEDDFEYVATDTDSPYIAFYEMADAGKKVYYLLRWLSKSGERGEWSETIEATVNG